LRDTLHDPQQEQDPIGEKQEENQEVNDQVPDPVLHEQDALQEHEGQNLEEEPEEEEIEEHKEENLEEEPEEEEIEEHKEEFDDRSVEDQAQPTVRRSTRTIVKPGRYLAAQLDKIKQKHVILHQTNRNDDRYIEYGKDIAIVAARTIDFINYQVSQKGASFAQQYIL
jgi:hypothetical protein